MKVNDIVILTDSSLLSTEVREQNLQNPRLLEILNRIDRLMGGGRLVAFVWVPSHVGLTGKLVADMAAKSGLSESNNVKVPHSDFQPLIWSRVMCRWQTSWDAEVENKLRKVVTQVGMMRKYSLSRRDEIMRGSSTGVVWVTHI